MLDVSLVIARIVPSLAQLYKPWVIVTHIIDTYHDVLSESVLYDITKLFWRQCIVNGDRARWYRIISKVNFNAKSNTCGIDKSTHVTSNQ